MADKREKRQTLLLFEKNKARLSSLLPLALLLALSLAFAACGQAGASRHTVTGACDDHSNSEHGGTAFVISCDVTFLPGVSYTQALHTVTDIGLMPDFWCPGGADSQNGSQAMLLTRWVSAGQQAIFTQWHSLVVLPTSLARMLPWGHDWMTQLQKSAAVSALQNAFNADNVLGRSVTSPVPRLDRQPNGMMTYACPPGIPTTEVTSSTLILPTASQCCSFVQVAFTSSVSYDTALVAITNLGMRLANPCHEADTVPPPAGQEANFVATHTLTLANTGNASTLWQSQLHATPGVSKVTTVGALYCVP